MVSGNINVSERPIFCRFYENNIAIKKAPKCSFSGTFSGHDQIKPDRKKVNLE
jgi:hypothetical protein